MWVWVECEDFESSSGDAAVVDDWGAAAMRCVRLRDGAGIRCCLPGEAPGLSRVDIRYRLEKSSKPGPAFLIVTGDAGETHRKELDPEQAAGWQWVSLDAMRVGKTTFIRFEGSGTLFADGLFVHDGDAPLAGKGAHLDESVGTVEAGHIRPAERRKLQPDCLPVTLPMPNQFLSQAALEHFRDARILNALAQKSCPYIVKPFDTAGGADCSSDYSWHALDKEKLWKLPTDCEAGVFNPNSGIWVGVGVGAAENCNYEHRGAQCVLHTVDALVYRIPLGAGLEAEAAFIAFRSDTLLIDVRVSNAGPGDVQVSAGVMRSCFPGNDPPSQVFVVPGQKFGSGVTVTAGGVEWTAESDVSDAECRREWVRGRCRGRRILSCLLAAVSAGSSPADRSAATPDAENVLHTGALLTVPAGGFASFRAALSVRRFTIADTWNPEVAPELYKVESEDEALQKTLCGCAEALKHDPEVLVRAGLEAYARYPTISLPEHEWEACFYACLELPRASTFPPFGSLDTPYYSFCRVHAQDPFGWWSYGMHAHESLCTLVANIVDPRLSADFLRGHIRSQREDGKYPYGACHSINPRTRTEETTIPLIVWEAWQSYLWSGDREFLAEAYHSGCRSHMWWLNTRDRCGEGLCHWLNTSWESARDDNSLVTWQLTGGSQYQEALDLNCYLLVQEMTLAEMAKELGMVDESDYWRSASQKRAKQMNAWMWDDEKQCYFGIGEVVECRADARDISTFFPLWAKLAPDGRFQPIAALLQDPETFGLPFGPPVLAADEPGFGPEAHWQGANWVEMSMFVVAGLRNYGLYRQASQLALVNTKMVFDVLRREGHFREYFNSVTGAGVDLIDYIWTAMPAHFIVGVFFGIEPRSDGLAVLPALPDGWRNARVENLVVRGMRVSVEVTVDPLETATHARLDGKPVSVAGNRGVFIPWHRVQDGLSVVIVQPLQIPETPCPPDEAPTDWSDIGPHPYPDNPELSDHVRSLMKTKEELRKLT